MVKQSLWSNTSSLGWGDMNLLILFSKISIHERITPFPNHLWHVTPWGGLTLADSLRAAGGGTQIYRVSCLLSIAIEARSTKVLLPVILLLSLLHVERTYEQNVWFWMDYGTLYRQIESIYGYIVVAILRILHAFLSRKAVVIHAAPRQGPPAPRSQGVISAIVVTPGQIFYATIIQKPCI